MTNAEIIFNQSMQLLEQGKIRTTGRFLTMRNDDGTTEQIPEPEAIRTFNGWKQLGFSVKKGAHVVAAFPIWKYTTKMLDTDTGNEELDKMNEAVNAEGGDSSMYMRKAFWFTIEQVEPTAEREKAIAEKRARKAARRAAAFEAIPAERALVVC